MSNSDVIELLALGVPITTAVGVAGAAAVVVAGAAAVVAAGAAAVGVAVAVVTEEMKDGGIAWFWKSLKIV